MHNPLPHTQRGLRRIHLMIPVLLLFVCAAAHAQIAPPAMDPLSFSGPDPTEQFGDISIEQKLDAQINLDLYFTTSEGQRVQLRDLMDGRPALLALVYYECPSLCKAELQGLEVVVSAMKFNPGEDYNIITVSIDPGETPEMAKEKKDIHVANVKRPGAEKGWHFLIGEEDAVSELANSVGFRYIYDPATDMYAHAAGIIALTPGGKTSRYFYGIEYIKRDVEWGLTEASEGTIGNIVDKLVLLCFQYDPTTGHYGLYVIRTLQLGSLLLILIFGSMYFLFYLRSRKKDSPDSIHEISGTHHGITS